jgi:hypothetical protein
VFNLLKKTNKLSKMKQNVMAEKKKEKHEGAAYRAMVKKQQANHH